MTDITTLWINYNHAKNDMLQALGGAVNIVGEFTRRLVAERYRGRLLPASHESADVVLADGTLLQVKGLVFDNDAARQLCAIKSWNFDTLVVVVYQPDGTVRWAREMDADVVKAFSASDAPTDGRTITINERMRYAPNARDVTAKLSIAGGVKAAASPVAHSSSTVARTSSQDSSIPQPSQAEIRRQPQQSATPRAFTRESFSKKTPSTTKDPLLSMKNKDFAMECIRLLKYESKTLDKDVSTLIDADYCRMTFDHSFAVLKKVSGLSYQEAYRAARDSHGHKRYYDERVRIGADSYIVTNDWYGLGLGPRDNRTPFAKWVRERTGNA